jgi:hypothetical protein
MSTIIAKNNISANVDDLLTITLSDSYFKSIFLIARIVTNVSNSLIYIVDIIRSEEIMAAKKKASKKGLASADSKTRERVAKKGGKS